MSRNVILILADGMRPDAIEHLPYVQQLLPRCAYTMQAQTVFPSVTLPCHMSLFLGVPPERHGITTNVYTPPVRPVDGLFEQLNHMGKISAAFYDWEQLRDLWRPGCLDYAQFTRSNEVVNDRRHTDAAIAYIREKTPDFVFLYMGYPDDAGHDQGWMSPHYLEAVRASWDNIRKVVEQFADSYTILITADHGGHDRIHGSDSKEDMTIPLLLLGPDFRPGQLDGPVSILDIAPTIAKLTDVHPAREWEGRVLLLPPAE